MTNPKQYWGADNAEPISSMDYMKEKEEVVQWITMNQDIPYIKGLIEGTDRWLEEVAHTKYYRFGWHFSRLWDSGIRGLDIIVETSAITMFAHRNKTRIVDAQHFIHLVGNKIIRILPYSGKAYGKEHYGIGMSVLKHLDNAHLKVCKMILHDKARVDNIKKDMGGTAGYIAMADKDNSTILDATLFTDTDEFIQAGVFLEGLFKKEGLIKNKSKKRRQHLQLILANLLHAHDKGKDSVSFSRNRNDYSPPLRRIKGKPCAVRYSPFCATHDPLIGAIDNLFKMGLIDGRKGYREELFPGCFDSSWSRMYATDKLLDLVEKDFSIDLGSIGYCMDNETVVLKDSDKNPIDYEDTIETKRMRKVLNGLNKLLRDTTLSLADYSTEQEEEHDSRINRPYNKFMYRIFNDSSFDKGGRFYGGYWITGLKKHLRKHILINGEKTVLLDFETMSMNLVYNYADLQCKPGGNPYSWSGSMDIREWEALQKIHKKLMQFALNTDSVEEWVQVAKGHFTKKRYPKQGPIQDRTLHEFLYRYHRPVAGLLFKKALGLQLMYTESRITESIIEVFTGKGIPILPIHDGFICVEEHKGLLEETMVSSYVSVTGKEPSGIHRE